VSLVLEVRRFFCDAAACARQIFAERFPGLATPKSRRSARLTALLQPIAVAVGGEAGARLVGDLGLTASPDTLLRLLRALPLPSGLTPRVLGVDDWARRRGRRYSPVLVDLLPDRSAETLAAWLAAHPGVEIIARDRSGAYADGARQGAPEAVPVADRWRLLKNVGDALERFLLGQQAALRQAHAEHFTADDGQGRDAPATPAAAAPAVVAPETSEASAAPTARPVNPRAARREARYAAVVDLQAAGHTLRAIARQTALSRMTVRK
jgi:hypothetical protein